MENRACRWSAVEDKFIKVNYNSLGIDKCAEMLNRPREGVKRRAFRLGITCSDVSKKKTHRKNKFICNVILDEGDIQPLVVRATSRDEARSYIKKQYGHKILDVKELTVNPDMRKDYVGRSIYGGFPGVRTTKHVKTKNYIQ